MKNCFFPCRRNSFLKCLLEARYSLLQIRLYRYLPYRYCPQQSGLYERDVFQTVRRAGQVCRSVDWLPEKQGFESPQDKRLSTSPNRPAGFRAHTVFFLESNGVFISQAVEQPRHEADYSPPSSVEVKNVEDITQISYVSR